MRFLIILILLQLSSLSQAQTTKFLKLVTRIVQPKDPQARCMNTQGISQTYCENKRKEALKTGCISQKEYQDLVRFGSTPSCDRYLALEKINGHRARLGLPKKKFEELTPNEKLQQLITWCPCGCFHPGSIIDVVYDDHSIEKTAGQISKNPKKYELLHLRDDARSDYFTYSSSPIRITTLGKENKPLIHIQLADGKLLRLTENHPVLMPDMKMALAKNIMPGMFLLKKDGSPVKVSRVYSKKFEGDVVNFIVDSPTDNPKEHVIFSDGIAVGDMYWQSILEHQIDRVEQRL